MRKLLGATTLVAITILGAGCGGNKINPLSYPEKVKNKVEIPDICKSEYKSVMPTVAVIDFTNNSTFGKADIDSTTAQKEAAAVMGVGVGPSGFIAGGASKSKSQATSTKRSVDAKLSSSITPLIESIVMNTGGAKLFTRSDMKKVDTELKLQDSGLLDPNSVVEFGKTSGVQYIITGSIDNVEQNYRDNTAAANGVAQATQQSDNRLIQMAGSLLKMGASVTDGMLLKTSITVKILDVQTGKILFSKNLQEDVNIGKFPNPTYDQIVGGIKSAVAKSLPQLEEDFSRYFAVKGYITKLRAKGKDLIAQVNIGRNYKVEENQIFKLYVFEESKDPMTGVISCDRIETPVTLKATNQITQTHTWATVEDGDKNSVKLLQLVQKSHEKGGFAIPKF